MIHPFPGRLDAADWMERRASSGSLCGSVTRSP